MSTVADIVTAVDRLAPFRQAESWDNVGLLLGDSSWPVRRVLVSLDVTESVVEEAERIGAEVLLAHHPLFFKDIDRLTADTREGRLALRLLAASRAVIAAHTNLDGAAGGLCDILAGMLGLEGLQPLRPDAAGRQYKVVVFVPETDLEAVRAATFAAGAGRIGNYTECSFSAEGTGTFLPGKGAEPAFGEKGCRNAIREYRLELLVPDDHLGGVLAAIGRTHSYEDPAIDVYPLHAAAAGTGIGRVGRLARPVSAAALADAAKAVLGAKTIQVAAREDRPIERVAVVTGGGSGLVDSVAGAACDAFVTGELKYHETESLAAEGIAVILGGHYRTERVPLDAWAPRLAQGLDAEVRLSEAERETLRPA